MFSMSQKSKVSSGHIFHLPLVQGDLAPWCSKATCGFGRRNLPNMPLIQKVGELVSLFKADSFLDLKHSEIWYGDPLITV